MPRANQPCANYAGHEAYEGHRTARNGERKPGKYPDSENAHMEPERRRLISESKRGPKNPQWKGDDVTYGSVHERTRRTMVDEGRDHCLTCGSERFEVALITGRGTLTSPLGRSYSPNASDYIPLCHRCHHAYDHGASPRDASGQFSAVSA
jgi:hypothetical protein